MQVNKPLYDETVVLITDILANVKENSYDRFNSFVQERLNGIDDIENARTMSIAVLNMKHRLSQNKMLYKKSNNFAHDRPAMEKNNSYKFQIEYCAVLYNLAMHYFNTVLR